MTWWIGHWFLDGHLLEHKVQPDWVNLFLLNQFIFYSGLLPVSSALVKDFNNFYQPMFFLSATIRLNHLICYCDIYVIKSRKI